MQSNSKVQVSRPAPAPLQNALPAQAVTLGALESSALIEHIQSTAENQKALLARELHDELGGLLVGAVMDLAWAEQHLPSADADLRRKLIRARQTLAAAIDLKRKLIEELRPTLLDNVGLFAALRWHVQAACNAASMNCTITLPAEEQRFLPHVPIALFRIVQEALAVIVAQGSMAVTDFSIIVADEVLAIGFSSRRESPAEACDAATEAHALAAVRYRATALGGTLSCRSRIAEGISIAAEFPLQAILLPRVG